MGGPGGVGPGVSESPSDEAFTFFVDTCLGTRDVPEALRAAGATVACLIDHFQPDEEDAIWLPEVGRRGWVVLTKDKWIRRRANEIEALRTAGVAAFILSARGLSGRQMATPSWRPSPGCSGRFVSTRVEAATTSSRASPPPETWTCSREPPDGPESSGGDGTGDLAPRAREPWGWLQPGVARDGASGANGGRAPVETDLEPTISRPPDGRSGAGRSRAGRAVAPLCPCARPRGEAQRPGARARNEEGPTR